MSARTDAYRLELRRLPAADWEPLLLERSGLPGPRGNLELAAAVADEADAARLGGWAALSAADAPTGSQAEFLTVCGAVGQGRLLVEASDEAGRESIVRTLSALARDPRWRAREGAAMALQRWGATDMTALLALMRGWAATPDRLLQRCAVAALCEPLLLRDRAAAVAVLDVLDGITASVAGAPDRRSEPFTVLRKALGYGWSVAVVAVPDAGEAALERWLGSDDADVRWLLRQNLRKDRLRRMDAAWVARSARRLERAQGPGLGR